MGIEEVFLGGGFAAYNTNTQIIGNHTVSGTKTFITPHPNSPDKTIRFIFTESPEVMIEYCGIAELEREYGAVQLPEEFSLMAEPGTYRIICTPQTLEDPGRLGATVSTDGIVQLRTHDGPATMTVAFVVYATRVGYKDNPVVIDKPVSMK